MPPVEKPVTAQAERQLPAPGLVQIKNRCVSVVTVAASTALHIPLSSAPSQKPGNLSPLVEPLSAFEQIGVEAVDSTKQERLAMYLSRDVPFAAFRLPKHEDGTPSTAHIQQRSQAVFSRTTVNVDTVMRTVADNFPSALQPTELVTGVGDSKCLAVAVGVVTVLIEYVLIGNVMQQRHV